jgi:glutathione S-transferase
MHSGFTALRNACPMNLHREPAPLKTPPEGLDADVARLGELWSWALSQTGGPWLGGPEFSAVDAFYAPVAFRLREYALSAPDTETYAARLLSHPSIAAWAGIAHADPRRITHYDEVHGDPA